ncbi:hypothetical protein DFJ58DRAFT_671079, partial [Suillus subalutaceus]|uniref:uncharacterized protein n=1 Tax=Suillus subalutaceus TaxID=48586 RepID=UPI001B86D355
VHYGCHVGRTIHALCNFQALLTNEILQMRELALLTKTSPWSILFSCSAMCTASNPVYFLRERLLKSVAGLEEWLMQGGDDEVDLIAELASLTKGTSGARGDDTKSLKGSVLDWITPKGHRILMSLRCQ